MPHVHALGRGTPPCVKVERLPLLVPVQQLLQVSVREEQTSSEESVSLLASQAFHALDQIRGDGVASEILDQFVVVHNALNVPWCYLGALLLLLCRFILHLCPPSAPSKLGRVLRNDGSGDVQIIRLAIRCEERNCLINCLLDLCHSSQAVDVQDHVGGVESDASGATRFGIPLPTNDYLTSINKADFPILRRCGVTPNQCLEGFGSSGRTKFQAVLHLT
mmetsp:Transcript_22286/g.40006  ORF Transcript_22286/g.40006 Transcript_22286/m.40006 type:complete len:220 (+) Transcript_22286:1498-2157(+)